MKTITMEKNQWGTKTDKNILCLVCEKYVPKKGFQKEHYEKHCKEYDEKS